MSKLTQELTSFFNKIPQITPAQSITIEEGENNAGLNKLNLSSIYYQLENLPKERLCEALWEGKRTQDYNCDGVILITDPKNNSQLLLIELKSKLLEAQFTKALAQIVISFLKIHTHFSLCASYEELLRLPVKAIICASNTMDWSDWIERKSTELDGKLSKEYKVYRSLLSGRTKTIPLKEVLKNVSWAQGWCIPQNLLDIKLELQILCSEGSPILPHTL